MNNDRDEPMAPIAGALISTKRDLERANLLSTKRFEGFGMKENNDPVERLRQTYRSEHKEEEKMYLQNYFIYNRENIYEKRNEKIKCECGAEHIRGYKDRS